MSRLCKLLCLVAALGASCARADVAAAPAAVAGDTDNLYVGIGMFSDMLNVNVENVTRWGNFMTRIGQFQKVEGLGINVSWRTPLEGDDGHASGFYLGFFGGQVAGETLNNDSYQRLGGGAEMGYHWVTDYTRTELTVGLGAAEPLEVGHTQLDAEPTLFISFNMALGY